MNLAALVVAATTLTQRSAVLARPASVTEVGAATNFLAPFVNTGDHQRLCTRGPMADSGSDYAELADCTYMAVWWYENPGYFDMSGWSAGAADTLNYNGSCFLRVSRADGLDGHVWMGNEDIGGFVSEATNLAHEGRMGALGYFNCSHPGGEDVQVIVSVMN